MWAFLLGTTLGRWILAGLACLLIGCGCWIAGDVHGHGVASAAGDAKLAQLQAQYAAAEAKAQADARAKESASAAAMAAITTQHTKELQDAQANADRIIADLRAGNIRLSKHWQCPATASVPPSAASAGGLNAAADDRAESASRIIGAADSADAQIRALQAIVKADRQ